MSTKARLEAYRLARPEQQEEIWKQVLDRHCRRVAVHTPWSYQDVMLGLGAIPDEKLIGMSDAFVDSLARAALKAGVSISKAWIAWSNFTRKLGEK